MTREAECQRLSEGQRRIERLSQLFLGLLAGVLAAGAIYQAVSEHNDRLRFPRPGQLVDVGSFRLNINCTGDGGPTVILENGLGIPAAGWALVQQNVEKFTRVCSYDRAGYGWSDPGPLPRTSQEIANELHAVLGKAGVSPPYVLVGHSFGGYNVRVYNGEFPGEVAGMVLVDASHEDEAWRLPARLREVKDKEFRWRKRIRPFLPFLIEVGIARALLAVDAATSELPGDLREELIYSKLQTKHLDAVMDESAQFAESAREVRTAGNLGNKPLIVLTAGARGKLPGLSKDESDVFFQVWTTELQPSLAKLSTRGRQIIVLNSHHRIAFEQPNAVVKAIQQVVHQCRDDQSSVQIVTNFQSELVSLRLAHSLP